MTMWYDILIQEPYFTYINSDPDFKSDDEDKNSLFSQYRSIVYGIFIGEVLKHRIGKNIPISRAVSGEYEEKGCLSFLQSDGEDDDFAKIAASIRKMKIMGWYQIDTEILSPEQIAFLIIYPFASRMGSGSFEVEFSVRGDLKKYINELKKKVTL